MSLLLVGAGYMGKEYAKVLRAMNFSFSVVGRSKESVKKFKEETGIPAVSGGIEDWLRYNPAPKRAIIAVTENQLGAATKALINAGCKLILVEKPGGLDAKDIKKVADLAKKKGAAVYVGYNRRFYASTQKTLEIIEKEGVLSFNFDFTERSYLVKDLNQSDKIKNNWFLQNSSHVIDLAFFMGGWPRKITAHTEGGLKWHPSGAVYAGAGMSDKGALFSYHANWKSAGKWSIEVITKKNKLIFRPLEKLQIQKYGSMNIEDFPLDDELDIKFKPGLYKQVESFLNNKKFLLTIEDQVKHLKYYGKIQKSI